jgi:hypothetical protein
MGAGWRVKTAFVATAKGVGAVCSLAGIWMAGTSWVIAVLNGGA